MPPRIARSNLQANTSTKPKNKSRKRNLDAFSIASHSAPEKNRIRSSRLGEFLDDRPPPKRRRDDDKDGEDEEEQAPPKRRRAVAEDEDEEQGSDSSGNEWTLGGLQEDDDDSELDSDEAFGESDDEKFEGFTFRGSRSGKHVKRSKATSSRSQPGLEDEDEIDLSDDESGEDDEDDDGFGGEGVDLATMLDDEDEELLGGKDSTARDIGEESESDGDLGEDDSASQADSESMEGEDGEEDRIARMRDRIDALDASSQPAKSTSTSSQPAALTVDDLLAELDPAQRKQFSSALKTKKRSERPKTLTAPLPKRQQDKLNREEATKKAKEQLDRWRDTVIRNRRAEFLSFPLNNPDAGAKIGQDKFVMGDEQVPANELEKNIRKIMEESGLTTKPGQKAENEEDLLLKAEELATNKMPVEEVMQRRADLRRARELLFREEIKAKRIKKIKSKAYRRVHRKERMRQEKEEDMLRELNGEADLDEDEQERFERKRAEARMNTKHRDSKFAKTMNQTNRAVWDVGAREEVMDEARRREELKRRIQGEEISDGTDNSDVPSDNDDSDGDDEDAVTLKQLNRLSGNSVASDAKQVKGLSAMKFMRAADERKRVQNEEDIERMRKDMAIEDGDEEESDDGAIDDQGLGRAIFGPKGREDDGGRQAIASAKKAELEEGESSENEDGDQDDDEPTIVTDKQARLSNSQKQVGMVEVKSQERKKGSALAAAFNDDQSKDEEQAKSVAGDNWLAHTKHSKKRNVVEQAVPTINMNVPSDTVQQTGAARQTNGGRQKKETRSSLAESHASNTDGWTLVSYKNGAEEDEDEEAVFNPVVSEAEKQKEYLRSAFAVDEAIESTFKAEKEEAAASEDEKEISNHLPGWGSWAGHGLSKFEKRSNAQRKHNPLHKNKLAGVKREDRKDAKLENVIISEKQNRKSKNYMAPILPHGFETKTQYERSLRLPMGPEWSTKEVFQRATRPRVVVKPGAVVEAMERPLV